MLSSLPSLLATRSSQPRPFATFPMSGNWAQASGVMDREVFKELYEDFLPQALAEGHYVAAPQPVVVGKGLDYIQVGLDTQKQGVSAKKVVVSL